MKINKSRFAISLAVAASLVLNPLSLAWADDDEPSAPPINEITMDLTDDPVIGATVIVSAKVPGSLVGGDFDLFGCPTTDLKPRDDGDSGDCTGPFIQNRTGDSTSFLLGNEPGLTPDDNGYDEFWDEICGLYFIVNDYPGGGHSNWIGPIICLNEPKPLGLDLALAPTVGELVPGGAALLQGGGLIAFSPLELVMRSTPVVIDLNDRKANAFGNFSFNATLPTEIEPGVHSLTLTGTKPDGNPISAVLYFELGADGKLLWAQKDTPKAAPASLAKTGADTWVTMGMLLGSLAMVGFGARLAFSGRRKA